MDVQCTRILSFKFEMVTNNGHMKQYVLKHIMDFGILLNKHACFICYFYLFHGLMIFFVSFHDTIREACLMSCRLLYSIFLQEKKIYTIPLVILKATVLSSTVDANEQHYQLSIRGENEESNYNRQPTAQEAQPCHAMHACSLILQMQSFLSTSTVTFR